jgi:CRP/FNR family cyclic AMP-dependent transcriptional regulator
LLSAWTNSVALLGPPVAEEAPENGYGKANDMDSRVEPVQYPPAVESVVWLRTVDIFQRVPYQLLAELSSRLRPLSVSAGVRVATEGDDGEELYIVRTGQIAVQHGPEVIASMGPGSVVGELAVLDPAPRSADLVATCDTDLLILDRTTLLDLMGRRPEVAADIVTMLVRRLRAGAPEA